MHSRAVLEEVEEMVEDEESYQMGNSSSDLEFGCYNI